MDAEIGGTRVTSDDGTKEIYGGIYPTSVLYATQNYIDGNPETIQKVTNATVKALEWMNTHSAEEIIEKLPKEFISGDRDTYIQAVGRWKVQRGRYQDSARRSEQLQQESCGNRDRSLKNIHEQLRRKSSARDYELKGGGNFIGRNQICAGSRSKSQPESNGVN